MKKAVWPVLQPGLNLNELTFRPVTPSRWPDLENLFGERGACGGCWRMFWRLPRKEFEASKGNNNKLALKSLVLAGHKPGLIGVPPSTSNLWR